MDLFSVKILIPLVECKKGINICTTQLIQHIIHHSPLNLSNAQNVAYFNIRAMKISICLKISEQFDDRTIKPMGARVLEKLKDFK